MCLYSVQREFKGQRGTISEYFCVALYYTARPFIFIYNSGADSGFRPEFSQNSTRIVGTKILSKCRNRKFENMYKICARGDKRLGTKPLQEGTKSKN